MSAVLVILAAKYGLPGIWVAGAMAGALLVVIGLLRLGRFIAFIPGPVITGFTSGIALIIFIGQIDNFLGVKTAATSSAALKLLGYLRGGFVPDWHAVLLGLFVAGTMLLWPKTWNARFPASLLAIVLVTLINALTRWPVAVIGDIPRSLLLADRLTLANLPWTHLQDFAGPALTLTALGAVESLLCGAVASNMTGIRLQANQELIAQGVGNLLIPFFGGVPATAAIARSSVGIKAGGQTRLVSIIHALALLASMFVLAPVMSRVPLAALAGVLMVTAWRMNEWEALRFVFGRRFKTASLTLVITMLATISLDLTQAILIGAFLSGAVFLNQIASLNVDIQNVDVDKLRQRGIPAGGRCRHVRVAYLTGPLFFAATGTFNEAFAHLEGTHALILSMRAVPLLDTSGLQVIAALHERVVHGGGTLMVSGANETVQNMLERGGLLDAIGRQNVFWSADQAIVAAEKQACRRCDAEALDGEVELGRLSARSLPVAP